VILLVNPPSPFLINQRTFPSLALLYLATVLREHRVEARILDLAGCADIDRELDAVDFVPELIGVSATTPQFGYAVHIRNYFKGIYPQVPIVIGGPHATVDSESCKAFDHVAIGEGESVIVNYRSWSSWIVSAPVIVNIDSIPHPDRDFVDIDSYHYSINGEKATTVMTSRGCPYDCAFCCRPQGNKVRFHSPEYVVEEIRLLKRRYGYNAFMFFDDIFVLPRSRVTRTTELLKREDIIYRCLVRSDAVDKSLLSMLKESGCVEIGFGAESGSQKILDVVGKKNSVASNTRLVELARELGIRTKAFLVIGLPGETHGTAEETYNWLRDVAPDDWDMSIYSPYRGSKIVDNIKLYDIEIDDTAFENMWYKGIPGRYGCSVSTSGLSSEEILGWRNKIETELGTRRYKQRS